MRRQELEEEEQKRTKGAEIGFTYDEDTGTAPAKAAEEEGEDEDEPYVKPESLKLPLGIVTPDSMRQNAVIERTAQFVVAQGPQMEVVIKAKQRQNAAQFGFLDFDHRLHSYYKYICKLIRENKYKPEPPKRRQAKSPAAPPSSASESDEEGEGGHYLHPLLSGGTPKAAPSPEPGFIGPSPRPIPQKEAKKMAAASDSSADFNALIKQFSGNDNSLYSTLLKGLHSVLPKTEEKEETTKTDPDNDNINVESAQSPSLSMIGENGQQQTYLETDQQRIDDYNGWHQEFYGRPSPYLPGPPPLPFPPAPDSAVESAVSVAAKYVALHGAGAEQRLIDYNAERVHFLMPRSPYYTFYQSRVRQLQWQFFHQSHGGNSPATGVLIFPTIPTPPIPPPISLTMGEQISSPLANPDLVPTLLPLDEHGVGASGILLGSEEMDKKQLERREKARLFMERILNERMSEKQRKKKKAEEEHEGMMITEPVPTIEEGQFSSGRTAGTAHLLPANPLSPYQLSKAISTLIDEQIKRTLAPAENELKEREKEKTGTPKRRRRRHSSSRSGSEERRSERDNRRKRRRKKERSRSRQRRTSSSEESDRERRRRRREQRGRRDRSRSPRSPDRRHRRPNRHSRSSRSKSPSQTHSSRSLSPAPHAEAKKSRKSGKD